MMCGWGSLRRERRVNRYLEFAFEGEKIFK